METTFKKRKSVALTKDELKGLKALVTKSSTAIECAEYIGIHRNVLDRVLLAGSGSFETVEKIRTAIVGCNSTNTAA